MNDRIKLAHALGWNLVELQDGTKYWQAPNEQLEGAGQKKCPDPFIDANDDYAVLEWVRNHPKGITLTKFDRFMGSLKRCSVDYEIGDYARAALKVLP